MIDNNTSPLRKVGAVSSIKPYTYDIEYMEDTVTHIMYMVIHSAHFTSLGVGNYSETEAMGLTVMYNSDGSLMKYDEFVKLYADYIE